jgi:hypothetical protein
MLVDHFLSKNKKIKGGGKIKKVIVENQDFIKANLQDIITIEDNNN